jgi:hypothetical protein
MPRSSRFVRLAVFAPAALLAVVSLSCGGSAAVTPPASLPGTTTTTSPSPTPSAAAYCPFGQGTDEFDCERTHSQLLQDVEDAMDMLIAQRPQIFNLDDEAAPGTHAYLILDKESYMNGLVSNLQTMGLCAERDIDDPAQETIFAKNTNDFSEEFDVVLSSGHMRRGTGAYRSTCTPASFPVPRPADAPPPGSGCYRPWPPPIQRMNCKLHIRGADYYTLDSTPIVLDPLYCQHFGFENPDCPVRPEGWPDRAACENYRVGTAADTGLPGPTWKRTDGPAPTWCTGPDSGCQHGEDSEYQLYVYTSGSFTVQAQTGNACTVDVVRY